MDLTPDQLYTFQTSKNFGEFRALFPNREAAFLAYASAAQSQGTPVKPTHTIEWRHIYHDNESAFLLVLSLIGAPLGVHFSSHREFRFITTHEFTAQQARRLILGRALGSLCYHFCFILIILCGVGMFVGILSQLLGKYSFEMTFLTIASVLGLVFLLIASRKTRTIGLPDCLKPIAKDTFDLLNIKAIKQAKLPN